MTSQIVTKWGNSLGIRIPRSIANQIDLAEGTEVLLAVENGNLVLVPQRKKRYTLDDLLVGMKPEHFHAEVDLGDPVGNEVW